MGNKIVILLLLSITLTGCSKKYTVTFNTDGGNNIESIEVSKGETLEDLENPKKEGYLFVGWEKDGREYNQKTPIKEDLSLTAKWIETPDLLNDYTVIFVSNGYEEKVTVKEGSTIEVKEAKEKEDYNFIGWYLNNEEYDFNTKVTKDMILVAKYEIKTVTVTYDLDGGIGTTSKAIPINTSLDIETPPVKEGYRFLKWTLDGEPFSFSTKITKDITIKAIWEKIEYITIKYDTDGGELIDSITIEKYSKINVLPIPKKEGYTFKTWELNNKTFDIDMTIEDNITLKAIYEKVGE